MSIHASYAHDHVPERERAAAAMRALGHAMVGHHASPELLARAESMAIELLPFFEQGAPRGRPVDDMKRRMFEAPPDDGATMDHFPDCIVSGRANPMGVAIAVHREGDDAVARVALGAAFEGAPQRAHGGIVAAIFDDVMGFVLAMIATPAFTGRLSVDFLAPTPVGIDIEFRGRLLHQDGRKVTIGAEAVYDGKRVAAAEGLFIALVR